jgi:hypothetical protein
LPAVLSGVKDAGRWRFGNTFSRTGAAAAALMLQKSVRIPVSQLLEQTPISSGRTHCGVSASPTTLTAALGNWRISKVISIDIPRNFLNAELRPVLMSIGILWFVGAEGRRIGPSGAHQIYNRRLLTV